MDSETFNFLQNSLRKHSSNEHMTYYEMAAVGKHFSKDLTTDRYDTIKEIAEDQYPQEQEKVIDFRRRPFESFANDLRMETPIMITEDMLFHRLVFGAVKEERRV